MVVSTYIAIECHCALEIGSVRYVATPKAIRVCISFTVEKILSKRGAKSVKFMLLFSLFMSICHFWGCILHHVRSARL